MNITHISISRMNLWEECEQKYKYKYHLQLKPEGPEPYYFLYGKIIHKISEEYVKNKAKIKIDVIAKDVITGKIPLERKPGEDEVIESKNLLNEIPSEYKRKLPEHIKSVKKLTDIMGTDGFTEWDFKHDLDIPNGKNVVGFIDRLFNKGDLWYIIDYKTTKKGNWRKTLNNVKEDMQLRTYARIVQNKFNIPAQNIRTALYYLEGNELIGAKFTEDSLFAVDKELLDVYNAIANKNADQVWGRTGNHCNFCEYKNICPFQSGTRAYEKYMKENS